MREQGQAFKSSLVECGHLVPMGSDGVFGFGEVFEDVVNRLNSLLSHWGKLNNSESIRFPPVMTRPQLEHSRYLNSFAHLAGTIHSFIGTDQDHRALLHQVENRENWTENMRATDLAMAPAACYSVYPAIAARGPISTEGALIDVCAWCFRREPSHDLARMQLFRMREYVRLGTKEQALSFRDEWMDRARGLARDLCLPHEIKPANDPFFGRMGNLLATEQLEKKLKFELLSPISSESNTTACISFNYAQDYFGQCWSLKTSSDEFAHTACVAFGIERLVLALFRQHGLKPQDWPACVRSRLWSQGRQAVIKQKDD